jgi:hypothetical protein
MARLLQQLNVNLAATDRLDDLDPPAEWLNRVVGRVQSHLSLARCAVMATRRTCGFSGSYDPNQP